MTTTRTPRLPVRRTAAGAAVTLTAALGLAVGPAGPGHAASYGWDPQDFAMAELPTTAVDGEITVTQVGAGAPNALRSFTRAGAPVAYATSSAAREHEWGPAGDLLTARAAGTGSTTTVEAGSSLEPLKLRSVPGAVQWSPYGDSVVQSQRPSGSTGFRSVATWMGSGRSDALTTTQPTDLGPATPLPDGFGALVPVMSADTPGKRDIGYLDTEFPRISNTALHSPAADALPLGYGALDARLPAVSAAGTLAFVGTGSQGTTLFVDEGNGPVAVRSLGGSCAGQRPSFAPSATAIAVVVSSADCSSSELRVLQRTSGSFVGGSDTLVTASAPGTHFETASWRPVTPTAQVNRLGGQDRIGTGIAVSRWGWPEGSQGAVLASATSFADAVVAGPLAAQGQVPLLLTGGTSLNSRVLSELKRLMSDPADRFVYLVGGTGVLNTKVEQALEANGFMVVRLAGIDRFTTSVAVAKELDAAWQGVPLPRSSAFLADGTNFPDALSAGPAATTYFAPVLLTNKAKVPSVVSSYVNGRKAITTVYGIGGNAARASRSFTTKSKKVEVIGLDRYETGQKVARTFFPGGSYLGYASGEAFADALTGGALMGALWEPLLLVKPTSVPAVVRTQADLYRGGTDAVFLFGGTTAVSDAVKNTALGYAGRQTALYGPTTPRVLNPDAPTGLGAKGAQSGTEAGIGGLARTDGAGKLPDAAKGFRSAAER